MSRSNGQPIPGGWIETTLSELGNWTGGGTPSKKINSYWDGHIPWVSPKDMKTWKLDDAQDAITEDAVADSAAKPFRENSLAFVVRSGILEHTLPIALVRCEATANQDIKVLTPSAELNPEWLLYALLAVAPMIRRECQKDGTTVASIDFPKLKGYPIWIPPRAEQERMVETVESAMAAVEVAERSLHEAAQLLTRLRVSLRDHAFASNGVPLKRLEEVADIQSGVAKSPPKGANLTAVPYIRTANVQAGFLELTEIKELRLPLDNVSKHSLRHGDVLILEGGDADKVGRGWIWEDQVPGAIHQNHVFAVRPRTKELYSRYLAHYVNGPAARAYFLNVAKQTTNLASINKTQLKAFPVPVPPIAEQRSTVTRLERSLRQAEVLDRELIDRKWEVDSLRRSILTSAVAGDLIEQDPADEPASTLLERIKAEQAEREAELKATKKTNRKARANRSKQDARTGTATGGGTAATVTQLEPATDG